MGVIWLYPMPILFDRFNAYVEPMTTPYILPLTQMALTGKDETLSGKDETKSSKDETMSREDEKKTSKDESMSKKDEKGRNEVK